MTPPKNKTNIEINKWKKNARSVAMLAIWAEQKIPNVIFVF